MAITYRSIAITDFAGEINSLVINKPAGLTVGDLMLSIIVYENSGGATQPSGWTLLFDETTGENSAAAWKIADSGDVAASNFTWTLGGGAARSAGAIIAATGVGQVNYGVRDRENGSTDTPVFTTGVTPLGASSMLVFFYYSTFTHTVSNYSIVTDNPTWVEIMDEQNVTPDLTMSLAYSIRSQVTATGNFSCLTSTTHTDHYGQLFYLTPQEDVIVSPAVINIPVSLQEPTVSAGAVVTPAVISSVVSVQAPTVATPASKYRNQSKHSADWINEDKS